MKLPAIEKGWTLFLDRDGVINEELPGDYVRRIDDFTFTTGAEAAIAALSETFSRTIIVTNQRGVGKGLMSLADLESVHQYMRQGIEQAGGRIDQIYYCTDLDNSSENRKPQTGMAMSAKADFPEIDFNKSVMIGNTLSDMQFGRSIGAFTIFIPSTKPELAATPHPLIDAVFDHLKAAAEALTGC